MERLTKRYNGEDKYFLGKYVCNYNKKCNKSCLSNSCKWIEEATCALAKYENSGFTPEELESFTDNSWQVEIKQKCDYYKEDRERTYRCLKKVETHARDLAKQNAELKAKLSEYENAEEQGLLVRLPIAIGGVVWEIVKTYQKDYNTRETKKSVKIEPKYVLGFEVLPCEKYIVIDNPHFDEKKNLDELGKTIFLTETEALQALKERE